MEKKLINMTNNIEIVSAYKFLTNVILRSTKSYFYLNIRHSSTASSHIAFTYDMSDYVIKPYVYYDPTILGEARTFYNLLVG